VTVDRRKTEKSETETPRSVIHVRLPFLPTPNRLPLTGSLFRVPLVTAVPTVPTVPTVPAFFQKKENIENVENNDVSPRRPLTGQNRGRMLCADCATNCARWSYKLPRRFSTMRPCAAERIAITGNLFDFQTSQIRTTQIRRINHNTMCDRLQYVVYMQRREGFRRTVKLSYTDGALLEFFPDAVIQRCRGPQGAEHKGQTIEAALGRSFPTFYAASRGAG